MNLKDKIAIMENKKPKIIAMWSGPRNISTAMMYSFKQRLDTKVLDEPFFGYFLKMTGVWRPSREEVLKSMDLSSENILKQVNHFDEGRNLFLKNMSNHIEGIDLKEIEAFQNIILLRHPLKVLNSFSKHIDLPTQMDLGYQHQIKIIDYLQSQGQDFLIVNSDDVCDFPRQQLLRICKFLKIDFIEDMLSWQAGPIPEDGIWAKYWYHNVHKSTGFAATNSKPIELAKELNEIYDESLDYYHKILKYHE